MRCMAAGGLEVGRVDFGEHVVFTPFPKRPAGWLAR